MSNSTDQPKPRRQQSYPDEVKNHARARWKAGDSAAQIAEAIGAPLSSVKRWVKGTERSSLPVVQLSREASSKTKTEPEEPPTVDIDRIAARLIDGSSNALDAIGRLVATGDGSDWLKGQGAHELAILYGVISDKLVRVLAAHRTQPEERGGV